MEHSVWKIIDKKVSEENQGLNYFQEKRKILSALEEMIALCSVRKFLLSAKKLFAQNYKGETETIVEKRRIFSLQF